MNLIDIPRQFKDVIFNKNCSYVQSSNGDYYNESNGTSIILELGGTTRKGSTNTASEVQVTDLDVADDENEIRCDWILCSPECVQPMARPACLLFWVCCLSFTQGMAVNGFVNAVLTTLEKRYDLQSVESGLIASMYDIGSLVFLIPVTYIAGRFKRSRLIAIGGFIMCLGCLIISLPQFTTGKYKYTTQVTPLCYNTTRHTSDTCSSSNSGEKLNNYKFVFWFGQFLNGLGAVPLYTLVVAYLDDNLTNQQSGLFLGIYYTMSVLGPAAGFLVGGSLLDVYVDLDTPSDITSTQEVWVGAWWIGFVIASVLAFIPVIPLFGFPGTFRGTKAIQAAKKLETYGNSTEQADQITMKTRDFCGNLKIILSNPPFMFISFAGTSGIILSSALSTFGPKYMQTVFQMKPSTATITIGMVSIPCAALGLFLGGLVIRLKPLTAKQICLMNFISSLLSVIGLCCFAIRCSPQLFSGVNSKYPTEINDIQPYILNASCNSNCHCVSNRYTYSTICGADNHIYYSPCYAGCTGNGTLIDGIRYYKNCNCITKTMKVSNVDYSAKQGNCVDGGCGPYGFLALIGLFLFGAFFTNVPALQVSMRVIPLQLKNFAMGIQWVFIRLLGSIPGPLVAGAIIDASCLLWKGDCTDEKGSCSFYDAHQFWARLFIFAGVCKAMELLFLFLAWRLYRGPEEGNKSIEVDISETKVKNGDAVDQNNGSNKHVANNDGIDNPIFVINS